MVGVELGVAVGEIDVFVGAGFAAFTICQTIFFPLFTHFNEREPDLATAPTLGQGIPGDLVAAKARGADSTAKASSADVTTRVDFFREAVMRKTLPLKEC